MCQLGDDVDVDVDVGGRCNSRQERVSEEKGLRDQPLELISCSLRDLVKE